MMGNCSKLVLMVFWVNVRIHAVFSNLMISQKSGSFLAYYVSV